MATPKTFRQLLREKSVPPHYYIFTDETITAKIIEAAEEWLTQNPSKTFCQLEDEDLALWGKSKNPPKDEVIIAFENKRYISIDELLVGLKK